MDKTILSLKKDIGTLRTGRANPAMFDLIRVDVYGQKMPINQLASITTPESRIINIQVWDLNNVNLIDSAIKKSDLGLNPQIDGQLIRLPIPELNEERRNELKKLIKSMGEKCKISIRNIRRDANEELKKLLKSKEISEDDEKSFEKSVQTITDKHIALVDEKVLWKDTTVSSQYGRIRAFFNYLSDNVKDYPPNLLNKLPIKRQKVITETFTRMEMDRCLQFLNKNKDNPKYEWFTPIFKVLVETGMRVSEVMKMRIKDVDVYERKIKILGKGRDGGKERWIHLRSDKVWSIIENQIYDENKEIRDTEWVFWVKYQNVSSGKTYYVENMNKPFNTSGFQHRFKDMIKELKMSDNLTPHALRRYFITEMLKKTKGNIPLVAQLVGHNTWDIVKHYTKNVVDENVDVNVGVI